MQRSHGSDTTAGFTSGVDRLGFSAAGFGAGLTEGVALTAAQLQSGTGIAVTNAEVRFIYDTPAGVLRFDGDGNGADAARIIATFLPLAPGAAPPTIAASDIVILA